MPKTKISEDLPRHFISRFGKMGVLKGTIDKKIGEIEEKGEEPQEVFTKLSLYSWDVVQDCRVKQCPAFKDCTYTKSGKCGVMMQYMKATSAMFFSNFAEELDEAGFYRIGMHLMPLYRVLCKLKIAEVGVAKVIITGATGRKYVNPIFREIRDCIKLIESLWSNMGLSAKGVPGGVEPKILEKDARTDYYAMIEGDNVLTKKERALMRKSKKLILRK